MIAESKLRMLDVRGVETRYYDSGGDGEPLVLVHGAHFGFAIPIGLEQWAFNFEELAQHCRVIAFDKLGQGFTDAPGEQTSWTFDAVARHAVDFIETLGLRDVTLLGHSRGALLAVDVAIARPDLVKRLVVISSATLAPPRAGAAGVNEAASMRTGDYTPEQLVDFLGLAQATDRAPPASFQDFVRKVAVLPKFIREGEMLARVEKDQFNPSLDAARDRALAYLDAQGLDMPVLVIWGMDDRSAPLAMGSALFQLIARRSAQARMVIINQAGHNVFIDQPAAFNSALIAFVTQRTDPPVRLLRRAG